MTSSRWRNGFAAVVAVVAAACGDEHDTAVVVEDRATPGLVTPSPGATKPPATATTTPFSTPTSTATRSATSTPTPTVTASPIDVTRFFGVYDADPPGPDDYVDWIGGVEPSEEGVVIWLLFDGHTAFGLTGTPAADGTVALEGFGWVEDDIGFYLAGEATLSETPSRQRVVGELHDSYEPDRLRVRFHFERSVGGRPSRFSGTYRVTLDPSPSGCECTTTAVLTLAIGDDGFGSVAATSSELDEHGAQLGTFEPYDCDVTDSGRMRCRLGYETSLEGPFGWSSFGVTLTGQLDAIGGAGVSSGIIFPSPTFLDGRWSAVRE